MLNIQIDEVQVRELYLEKLEEKIKEMDNELVFWDSKELVKRTCMSWGSIQEKFLYDPRLPKFKVGQKWMFPAAEAKEFLLKWIKEQPKR